MPYINLTPTEIAELLRKDGCANWSYKGSYALAHYLEGLEDDGNRCHICGCDTTRIEIDITAIRCEYSEYDNALEAARAYGNDYSVSPVDDDDNERPMDEVIAELEAYCLDWLQERTNVLAFDGGIIIEQF